MANRKQRRQLSSLDELIRMEGLRATDRAVEVYSAALALCLKDKLGFGPTRAQRFLGHVWQLFQDVEAGHLTLEDIQTAVREELGINVKRGIRG